MQFPGLSDIINENIIFQKKSGDKMPPLSILIKPASSACNLQCRYCFYHDVAENRDTRNYGLMTFETLEILVQRAFECGEYQVGFAFQGGEPTLAGLDFYKKLLEFQKKYNVKKIKVTNALQTNGTVIDKEWAMFLAENHFLVGLSLDGPKEIHDLNRINATGAGTYSKIEKTINLFNTHRVTYNILCVVTKSVARHIGKVYNYFIKKGFRYLQFIPCLDELGVEPGLNPYSLTPDLYEEFLKRLFDLWFKDFLAGKEISIRMFDNIVQMLLGYPPESCDMKGACSANIIVEADGSVYPCDFYVLNEWKMGDVLTHNFQGMLTGETARKFVEVSQRLLQQCRSCRFFFVCRGGCRRHYEPLCSDNDNYFCTAYQGFYAYALPRFYEIAHHICR